MSRKTLSPTAKVLLEELVASACTPNCTQFAVSIDSQEHPITVKLSTRIGKGFGSQMANKTFDKCVVHRTSGDAPETLSVIEAINAMGNLWRELFYKKNKEEQVLNGGHDSSIGPSGVHWSITVIPLPIDASENQIQQRREMFRRQLGLI